MKVLLLGVGLQGNAALYDLVHSPQVTEVIAADRDFEGLKAHIAGKPYDKVRCEAVDAADPTSLDRLMQQGPDVVIDLLPVPFVPNVARAAVKHGVHLVNTSYVVPQVTQLADEAKARNVTILPEFGMDPGIDLVLLGQAVRSFESVEEITTYGAGFPEPEAADNPLQYKVTWTFAGLLNSYRRAARIIRDYEIVDIAETEIFSPENIYTIDIEGLGTLEAFANGDALKYAALLGVDVTGLRNLGRYVLRWPGHCAFWKKLVDLHLLDDEPVLVDGVAVKPKRFLAAALEPHIQYRAHERDIVVARVEVTGEQRGKKVRAVYQVIDRRDLETGHTAMSRTVGYTASIGAQMVGGCRITQRGVLSPVTDIPYEHFVQELGRRGIHVTMETSAAE